MTSPAPRILLVKLSSLGDVIHTLPALEALRALYPAGRLVWLVEDSHAPLLWGHPALDEVLAVPRLSQGRKMGLAGARRLWQMARRLRRESFDLVIDFQGLLKSALWVTLARSPRKLGYHRTREFSYMALTERLPPFDPERHAVWRYLHLVRHLGAPDAPPRFRLALSPDEKGSRLGPLEEGRPLAILHPGARWATKLWPARRWAELADWLEERHGFQVAITGSLGDQKLVETIAKGARRPLLSLAGRTSLNELAVLLKKATLAVTTDTGPMHLAAALGTPVAALFGPTAPWRTGPFGDGHQVVRLGLSCSPCFRRHCPEPRCLIDLPLAAVQAAVEKILLPLKQP